MFINTSDDSDLLTQALNDTTSNEYDGDRKDVTPESETAEQTTQDLIASFEATQENDIPAEDMPFPDETKDNSKTDNDADFADKHDVTNLFESQNGGEQNA